MNRVVVEEQIIKFLRNLGYVKAEEEVDLDLPLEETYNIDSLSFIELIVFCEVTYGFEFEIDELDMENFSTINKVVDGVVQHMNMA